ncbi:protein LTV1 homolog [Antedon mediterranea]|uniref:protein LTV1 homolog n=1 Tax=Antedon mediterranea TaxID=105859 RepID=UPI003AF8DDDC
MPGKKKKKFIDKNKAVSFHLVHRSQKDPLQADEDINKFVLLQTENPNDKSKEDFKNRKEEERKFGVFYDDEYNYLQHLRKTKPQVEWAEFPKSNEQVEFVPKLQLPQSVFPSKTEEDVGLLNKAAPIYGPRVDWDPDIVAALDGDADFENPDTQLDDDFMLQAMADGAPEEDDGSEEGYDSDECYMDDEEGDRFDPDDMLTFRSEETKSHFTNYSMTSSVIRRNEGLTFLDDKFEQIFEQYNDMEIGALDHDEMEGHITTDSAILNQVLSEFEKSRKKHTATDLDDSKDKADANIDCDSDSNDEELENVVVEPPKEKWDCESILSTYSNLYNHPKTIKEPSKKSNRIKLSQKTGMPLDVLDKKGATKQQMEQDTTEDDDQLEPSAEMLQARKKGQKELAEDKRQRKDVVKAERRERRLAKKANKIAFKEEEKRQEKVIINLQQNMKGIKMT